MEPGSSHLLIQSLVLSGGMVTRGGGGRWPRLGVRRRPCLLHLSCKERTEWLAHPFPPPCPRPRVQLCSCSFSWTSSIIHPGIDLGTQHGTACSLVTVLGVVQLTLLLLLAQTWRLRRTCLRRVLVSCSTHGCLGMAGPAIQWLSVDSTAGAQT